MSMKKIFVLTATNSYGADVYSVSVFNTFEEARAEMERQYNEELANYFDENEEEAADANIWKDCAELYYNGDEDFYHWQIHTVSFQG